MPQLTVCPSCAERRDPADKFCGNCGANLAAGAAAAQSTAPAAPPTAPEHRRPWQPPSAAPPPRGAAHDESTAPGGPGGAAADSGAQTVRIPVRPVQTPAVLGADGRPPYALPAQASAEPDEEPTDSYLLRPASDGTFGAPPAAGPRPVAAPPPAPRPGAPDPRADLLAPAQPLCVACGTGQVDRDGCCERCGHTQPRERDHLERETAGSAAVTDRGLRHHRNEDAFAICEAALPDGTTAAIAVVCDGVSSAARPDEASAAAADAASTRLSRNLSGGLRPREATYDALLAAAETVSALADPAEDNAPACTCVSAVISGDVVTVGWVGDSRAYWVPDDRAAEQPARLTEDDSWAAKMVEAGLMSEEQAYADDRAHAITGWLGADAVDLDPHTVSFAPDRPGVVVICTDGLWNYAESAADFGAAVRADARIRPLACAQALVGVALDGGGHDNITVAVLPFDGGAGDS